MKLNELKGNAIAFGTNLTLPLIRQKSGVEVLKSLRSHIRLYTKKEQAGDWNRTATRKSTGSLIPCVRQAYKEGIRVFDCSRAYGGSEERLAKALKDIPRENVFIITKITDSAQFLGQVEECFNESLSRLNTEYVDLLLLHWPVDYPKIGGVTS